MKAILTAILLACFVAPLYAQTATVKGTIKGIVIDSAKNTPLGYATIAIVDAETKQPVKSGLSKDNGSFEFGGLPIKPYLLNVISVGYQTKTLEAGLKADKASIDLGKIMLGSSNSQLNEVKVTAPKPLVKQEIDRVSYDVQADPESKVSTAMDMLRKVPLVSVDGDDNIQLQGSGSYKIFINGKPSTLLAANPKDVLKSMPANTIVKIEVITTPPAKYDAEGLAGIINIITTRKTDDGYNGTITARYNYPWGPNVNLTGTYKKGKFGLSGYVGLGRQLPVKVNTTNTRETFDPVSMLNQQGYSKFGGNFLYESAEMSYEIDTLNLLTGSFNFNRGKFNQDYGSQYRFADSTGITTQAYNQFNNGNFDWKGTDVGLDYQHGFAHQAGRLLTLSYKYSYSSNGQNGDITTIDRFNYSDPDYSQFNNAGSKEHTFQLDYVHPLKKLNIEAGAKAILRNNFSDFETQNLNAITGLSLPDTARSDNFNYQQNVYSAYNSYQLKLTKWTFKGGLRVEHTSINADFASSNIKLDMGYNNFVPSLSVMRSLKNNVSLTFGFTNRIERPGIYNLNPYVDQSNPRFLSSGNPNLRPVISHLLELSFNKSGKGSFGARLSQSFINNSIQNVTTLLNDTVSLSTYDNIGKRTFSQLNLNYSYPITPKINITANGSIGYITIKGLYNNENYNTDGYRANGNANLTYKVNDFWRFGFNSGYSSPYILLQGKSSSYIYNSVNAAHTFWDKKATITVTCNNPYQQYRTYQSTTTTPDFTQRYARQNYYRTFGVSFSYKFGKLSSEIKKNQRSINNDDVSSGGGKSN